MRPRIGSHYCLKRISEDGKPLCCAVNPACGRKRLQTTSGRLLGIANRYLLTGDVMDGRAACGHGFANHMVPAEGLLAKAREAAGKMITKSVLGLRMTKETINRNLSASLDQAIQPENRNQVLCLGSRPIINPLKAKQ